MSKRTKIITAIVAAAVVLIGGGAALAVPYYRSHYVTAEYYAHVTELGAPITMKDMSGKVVGHGYEYNLTAVGLNGAVADAAITVAEPGTDISIGEVPPTPGEYLEIQMSSARVASWKVVDPSAIPATVLEALNH